MIELSQGISVYLKSEIEFSSPMSNFELGSNREKSWKCRDFFVLILSLSSLLPREMIRLEMRTCISSGLNPFLKRRMLGTKICHTCYMPNHVTLFSPPSLPRLSPKLSKLDFLPVKDRDRENEGAEIFLRRGYCQFMFLAYVLRLMKFFDVVERSEKGFGIGIELFVRKIAFNHFF